MRWLCTATRYYYEWTSVPPFDDKPFPFSSARALGIVCGRFRRATASTEKNRDDSFELRKESGGLHAQFEGIITVLLR